MMLTQSKIDLSKWSSMNCSQSDYWSKQKPLLFKIVQVKPPYESIVVVVLIQLQCTAPKNERETHLNLSMPDSDLTSLPPILKRSNGHSLGDLSSYECRIRIIGYQLFTNSWAPPNRNRSPTTCELPFSQKSQPQTLNRHCRPRMLHLPP